MVPRCALLEAFRCRYSAIVVPITRSSYARSMAGASDKARYYLEQSVPELQELIRKQIFTKVSCDEFIP